MEKAPLGGAPAGEACQCDLSHIEPECFCPEGSVFGGAGGVVSSTAPTPSPASMSAAMFDRPARPPPLLDLGAPAFDDAGVSAGGRGLADPQACDACPFCGDVCGDPRCVECREWRVRPRATSLRRPLYTPCEVRRHCTASSCWLVTGHDVYDATKFLPRHPAGTKSIVRSSGGRDCTEDLGFHSAKAQRLWAQYKIGRLAPCPSERPRGEACSIS